MIRLVILFFILCFLYNLGKKETFCGGGCGTGGCGCGRRCNCGRPGCPFCNRTNCPTRNMSYDLRGEAFFPERTNFPFDNSVIGPSNRGCYPKSIRLNEYL